MSLKRLKNSGWGIHVTPWLIHVNVWQNPLKCCEVISLQLIKINEKKRLKSYFSSSNLNSVNIQLVGISVCVCSTMPDSCNPMDCGLPGSSVHGISQDRVGMGWHFLLQGIFLTQGSNLCLLHWQTDSLPLGHLGSPGQ